MHPPALPPPLPPPAVPPPRGFWVAFGLGLAGIVAMLGAQVAGGLIVGALRGFQYAWQHHRAMPADALSRLATDPLLVSVCSFLSIPVVWTALFFMVWIQRGGRMRDFLALRGFSWKQFLLWLAALAAVLVGGEQFLHGIGETSDQNFTLGLLLPDNYLPWIVLAVVVAAPVVEEPLFRGFMYRGMARSRWTTLAAIVIPNCLWVLLHVQYNWPTLLVLFTMGLVLALSRHFSGSTLLPIVLHFLSNGFAVLAALTLLHPSSLKRGIDLSQNTVLGYAMKAEAAEKNRNDRQALVNYAALLKLDPENQSALEQRGLIYKRQRKYERALTDFTQLQKLAPKNTEALYQRAYVYILQGKYDPSIADLDHVLQIDPHHYRAYWLRAFAFEQKGDRKRAISDNTAALKLNPKFGPAISDLGTAYLKNGDYDRAIEAFDRAIRNSPDSSNDYSSRGLCYWNKGDLDRAISDYNASIRLDPWYASTYRDRGVVWQEKRDYRQALSDFRRALEINPDSANAANSLSWLFATCPDPVFRDGALALKYAEQACRLTDWDDPIYLDTMAAACAEAGNFEKAVWWQEKCLRDGNFPKREMEGAQRRLELYRNRRTFIDQ